MGDFFNEKKQVERVDKSETIVTIAKLPSIIEKLFTMIKQYVKAYNDKYYYHKGYINKMEDDIEKDIEEVNNKVIKHMQDKSFYVIPKYDYGIVDTQTNKEGYKLASYELDLNANSKDFTNEYLNNVDYRNVIYIPPCDKVNDKGNDIPYIIKQKSILDNRSVFGDGVRTIIKCGETKINDPISENYPAFSLGNNSYVRNLTLIKNSDDEDNCCFIMNGNNIEISDILSSDDNKVNIKLMANGDLENVVIDNVQGKLISLSTLSNEINIKNMLIKNCIINSKLLISIGGSYKYSDIKFENCIISSSETKFIEGANLQLTLDNCTIKGPGTFSGLKGITIKDCYLDKNTKLIIANCRDIEILNNTLHDETGEGAITINELTSCRKFNISNNDYTNDNQIKIEVKNNNGSKSYNVLWERQNNGISMLPIDAAKTGDTNTSALKSGEFVLFNDSKVNDGGETIPASIAMAYVDDGKVQVLYPFAELAAKEGRMGFMTNWEVSTMVKDTCTYFYNRELEIPADIDTLPKYGPTLGEPPLAP